MTATVQTNINEFVRDLQRIASTMPREEAAAFQRKIALRVLKKLVKRTPVGDPSYWQHPPPKDYEPGSARRNWQVSTGFPKRRRLDEVDPAGDDTIEIGAAVIAKAAPFSTIFFSNNVPYIQRLEEGWSHRQAPNGMVAVTLAEFEGIRAGQLEGALV